ncbi:single-stranded DNA-binding protein [Tropilaelaps mercedesae]|uniref:Single-stranded DNA-binding protein n=1 Tax=Tropilaelaps mercedesae TaxID=418985 RepID=A0A1V9X6B0_9ACAR|nr:single-stranded DNA-binding protein [Tropilaelaps mercedesae]
MLAARTLLRSILKPVTNFCRMHNINADEHPIKTLTTLEKSINRVTLLGRVGIDPQMRGTEENPVVLFTLATNHNYRFDTGDIQQKTEWHRVSVFRPYLRDSVAQNVKKGYRVLVEGRLVYGEFIDAKGQTQLTCTIVASEIVCLGGSRDGRHAPAELKEDTDSI